MASLLDSIFSNPSLLGGLLGRDWRVDPNQSPISDFLFGKQNQSGASGVDESGFNMAYPQQATTMPPQQASAAPQMPQPQQPSSMGSYGGIQYPIFGQAPPTVDMSAQSRQAQPQQQPQQQLQPSGAPNVGNPLGTLGTILLPNTSARIQSAQSQQQLVNATYQAVLKRTGDPVQAAAVAQGVLTFPKLAETILPQALGLNPPKTMEELIARQGAGEKFPGAQGGAGGGMQGGLNSLSQLKSAEAAGTAQGTAIGTAKQQLLPTLDHFDQSITDINELLKDPNLKHGFGIMGRLESYVPGSPGVDVQAKINQVAGEASMLGLQQMRGLGRLNINEFNAGTKAITALSTAQSESAGREALGKLKDIFTLARSRAGELANVGPTPAPQSVTSGLPKGWSVQVR